MCSPDYELDQAWRRLQLDRTEMRAAEAVCGAWLQNFLHGALWEGYRGGDGMAAVPLGNL